MTWQTFALLLATSISPLQFDSRALVEQAMDEPTKIILENVKLADAIGMITEQTGVNIVMEPQVMGLVPHGGETLIRKVEIIDVPLRQGLTELLDPLGMTFVVHNGFVEVFPKQALLCLGRPPTWGELDTLAFLSSIQPGVDPESRSALKARVQFRVAAPGAWEILDDAMAQVGAGPGDVVLTVACDKIGWAWCLSGEQLVITSVSDLIRRQLQQPIDLRINNRRLVDLFQELSQAVHVPIRAEPGALQHLPPRTYSVNISNAPAEQALEKIAAETGLGYLVEPDGVLFYRASGSPDRTRFEAKTVPTGDDPYLAKIIVPLPDGTSIEWLIRRSELPPDLKSRRQADLRKAFEAVRQSNPN